MARYRTKRFQVREYSAILATEGAKEVSARRKGIALNYDQYRELTNALRAIEYYLPELRDVVPCYVDPNHVTKGCNEFSPA